MSDFKHTEGSIIKLLDQKYDNDVKYKISNSYIFKSDWESDFFVLRRSSGYCYEIEVKISRSDFFNDKKKISKHLILENGHFQKSFRKYSTDNDGKKILIDGRYQWESAFEKVDHNFRPNKFYYCVPKDLIKVEEIPEYAGLMYADEYRITVIKEPKFLHKEKLKFEEKLCTKFYYYWQSAENELRKLKWDYDDLKGELDNIKNKH